MAASFVGTWSYRSFINDPDLSVPITQTEQLNIHGVLASYSPPHELRAEIEQWELDEDITLLPEWPTDLQLAAALALFDGEAGS